jgi:hypothetical protein
MLAHVSCYAHRTQAAQLFREFPVLGLNCTAFEAEVMTTVDSRAARALAHEQIS